MGKAKVKSEPETPGAKKTKKSKKRAHSDSEDSDTELVRGPDGLEIDFELPPKEVLGKLLDNIEAQLPKEDHVKYDSRAKKLDWEKIRFDNYSGTFSTFIFTIL